MKTAIHSLSVILSTYQLRLEKVLNRMDSLGIDALILSLGADLPWLSGYEAMPLERLTALVVRPGEEPVLVVPALEAPRVELSSELFRIRPWREYEDPHELVANAIKNANKVAISDRTWASSVLRLQQLSNAIFVPSSVVTSRLRAIKDDIEISLLREAAMRTDRVANALISGEIKIIGRSERQISLEISERLLSEGLSKVNFAIVGSGPNSSSPHHEPGNRIIAPSEAVVCDFGGEYKVDGLAGYCSDITRTVVSGEMPERFMELYSILYKAQELQLKSIVPSLTFEEIDNIGRSVIKEHGYGDYFIHRTGHGIGIEEHEEPYIVDGNSELLEPGNAFSVEPGIYIPNLYGARIEDIVVVTDSGCETLNNVDRTLKVIDQNKPASPRL